MPIALQIILAIIGCIIVMGLLMKLSGSNNPMGCLISFIIIAIIGIAVIFRGGCSSNHEREPKYDREKRY